MELFPRLNSNFVTAQSYPENHAYEHATGRPGLAIFYLALVGNWIATLPLKLQANKEALFTLAYKFEIEDVPAVYSFRYAVFIGLFIAGGAMMNFDDYTVYMHAFRTFFTPIVSFVIYVLRI